MHERVEQFLFGLSRSTAISDPSWTKREFCVNNERRYNNLNLRDGDQLAACIRICLFDQIVQAGNKQHVLKTWYDNQNLKETLRITYETAYKER